MIYRRQIRIEFNHCDPAGIVFYPRYFEMTNSVVENFFRDVVDLPFETMMVGGEGVPTARLEVNFNTPSKLGEILDWHLLVMRLGTTSLSLNVEVLSADTRILSADLTLVYVNRAGRPQPWPQSVRDRFINFMEKE